MNTVDLSASELPQESPAAGLLGLAERALLPDFLIRAGIRQQCRERLAAERAGGPEAQEQRLQARLLELRSSPLAVHTEAANAQHYELPPAFFQYCLGQRLKYSCAYYPTGNETLDQAELAMLELYGERAQLADGQEILELGCGWGSLTLWMAERYPASRIRAISNSSAQRLHIEQQCRVRGLHNVTVVTCDVNRLSLPPAQFDRCVSVEMFEHLRNYETLLARIAGWLKPDGKLFVHVFAHRDFLYPFETSGPGNWMGRHFFTGGLMPSADTFLWFQKDLAVEQRWRVSGTHYGRTANHWLANQDRHASAVRALFSEVYGPAQAALWIQRWRMFWMACAETFSYDDGRQWIVGHYRFARS
jgi:cyclopropane-fatty-acyl-phospholipid synthase